jgi:two-component system phosphate regulon response regulator PhoB
VSGMMVQKPRVLLIEQYSDLRELNELILRDAGYEVEAVAPSGDPVEHAARTRPDGIVAHVRPTEARDWELIDRLEADPRTEAIPVVVISSSERAVTEARAAPVVRETVVMPYDIDALREAVAKALGNPPPAAVLPPPRRAPPPSLAFAGGELSRLSREIVLRAISCLQQIEPFRSRFAELSPALVDELPVILGAVAAALRRDLPPDEITAPAALRAAIQAHVNLRLDQGLELGSILREYQVLQDQALEALRERIGQAHFSAIDAFDVARVIDGYFDQIVQVTVSDAVARLTRQVRPASATGTAGSA